MDAAVSASVLYSSQLDQIVDAERGGSEFLRERVQVRSEEMGELWHLLLVVSSYRTELPAHLLLVLVW